jgi:hypothetical protein
MMPVWTLKLGSVAVTLASTVGFWRYVTQHVHPVQAPLKPKVAQPEPSATPDMKALTSWNLDQSSMPAPTPTPVVVKKVVVVQAQQQVQNTAALGASYLANRTGQRPVQNTHVS